MVQTAVAADESVRIVSEEEHHEDDDEDEDEDAEAETYEEEEKTGSEVGEAVRRGTRLLSPASDKRSRRRPRSSSSNDKDNDDDNDDDDDDDDDDVKVNAPPRHKPFTAWESFYHETHWPLPMQVACAAVRRPVALSTVYPSVTSYINEKARGKVLLRYMELYARRRRGVLRSYYILSRDSKSFTLVYEPNDYVDEPVHAVQLTERNATLSPPPMATTLAMTGVAASANPNRSSSFSSSTPVPTGVVTLTKLWSSHANQIASSGSHSTAADTLVNDQVRTSGTQEMVAPLPTLPASPPTSRTDGADKATAVVVKQEKEVVHAPVADVCVSATVRTPNRGRTDDAHHTFIHTHECSAPLPLVGEALAHTDDMHTHTHTPPMAEPATTVHAENISGTDADTPHPHSARASLSSTRPVAATRNIGLRTQHGAARTRIGPPSRPHHASAAAMDGLHGAGATRAALLASNGSSVHERAHTQPWFGSGGFGYTRRCGA